MAIFRPFCLPIATGTGLATPVERPPAAMHGHFLRPSPARLSGAITGVKVRSINAVRSQNKMDTPVTVFVVARVDWKRYVMSCDCRRNYD